MTSASTAIRHREEADSRHRRAGRLGDRRTGGACWSHSLGNKALRSEIVRDDPTIDVVDVKVAVGVARRAAEAAVASLPDEEVSAVDDGVAVEIGGKAEEFGRNLPADVGEGGVVERGEQLALAQGKQRP